MFGRNICRFYKVISDGNGQQRKAAVCQAGDDASRYQMVDSTQEIMEIKGEQKKLLLLLLLLYCQQHNLPKCPNGNLTCN